MLQLKDAERLSLARMQATIDQGTKKILHLFEAWGIVPDNLVGWIAGRSQDTYNRVLGLNGAQRVLSEVVQAEQKAHAREFENQFKTVHRCWLSVHKEDKLLYIPGHFSFDELYSAGEMIQRWLAWDAKIWLLGHEAFCTRFETGMLGWQVELRRLSPPAVSSPGSQTDIDSVAGDEYLNLAA